MQKKLIDKKKDDLVICTKHLLFAKVSCPYCAENKRKARGGFSKHKKQRP